MKRRSFRKSDWLELGLSALAAKGPEAVKLEAVCKAAGLTRGSFYHHFADHEAFLTALGQTWLAEQTDRVAQSVDPDAPPEVQNDALTEAAMQIDYRLELGIRELGRRLPAIETIIKKADAIRLDVLTALYQSRYELDRELAQNLAFIEYAAFSGIILLDPDIDVRRQKSLAELYERTISAALNRGGAA